MVDAGDKGATLKNHYLEQGSVEAGDKVFVLSAFGKDRVFSGIADVGDKVKVLSYKGVRRIIATRIRKIFYVGPAFHEEPVRQFVVHLIGKVDVPWDGVGRVWVTNYKDHIYASADDGYYIHNLTNSLPIWLRKYTYGKEAYNNDPPPEITSIMEPGYVNHLEVYVQDWYGGAISNPVTYIALTA